MNSTFANLEGHRKMEARKATCLKCIRWMRRPAASSNGESVRIFNDRGSMRLTAHVNGSVPRAWWRRNSTGPNCTRIDDNVNALTSERLTDLGAGATFYSTLVEVSKA